MSTGIKFLVFLSFFMLNIYSLNAQIATFDGAIKLSNDTAQINQPGVINWNSDSKNFEGYDGQQWQSLTFNPQSIGVTFVYNEAEFNEAISLNKTHIVIMDSIMLSSKLHLVTRY